MATVRALDEEKEGELSTMKETLTPCSVAAGAETPSRRQVWRMFDRIAPRYDLLNRLLSFGQDVRWRKRVADFLPASTDQEILDLATGTADQLLFLVGRSDRVQSGTGMDLSAAMLERGRRKVERRGLSGVIRLELGDAMAIPAPADAYDAATIAFGIRNVEDVDRALGEMFRVLKPGGRALILEFSLPGRRFLRAAHLCYLRHVLPRVGGWISGDPAAYRYLNATIETFPTGEAFCARMRRAGFRGVGVAEVTWGVASIYYGDKPPARHSE